MENVLLRPLAPKGDLALRQLAYGMAERYNPDLRTTCKHTFQIEGGAGISARDRENAPAELLRHHRHSPRPPSTWPTGSVKGSRPKSNFADRGDAYPAFDLEGVFAGGAEVGGYTFSHSVGELTQGEAPLSERA